MMFAQNVAEVRSVARALARRASRVTPAGAAAAASRATADLARFPATLAESLGKALVPGGWMHDAVSVATVGFDFFLISCTCTCVCTWWFRCTLHAREDSGGERQAWRRRRFDKVLKLRRRESETRWGVNDVG